MVFHLQLHIRGTGWADECCCCYGCQFAGRIAKNSPIPKGCPYKPGDRVFGVSQGSYAGPSPLSLSSQHLTKSRIICVAHEIVIAERVAADPANLHPIPDYMSYDQAAGLYVTWPTSYEGIVGRGQTKAGMSIH